MLQHMHQDNIRFFHHAEAGNALVLVLRRCLCFVDRVVS